MDDTVNQRPNHFSIKSTAVVYTQVVCIHLFSHQLFIEHSSLWIGDKPWGHPVKEILISLEALLPLHMKQFMEMQGIMSIRPEVNGLVNAEVRAEAQNEEGGPEQI